MFSLVQLQEKIDAGKSSVVEFKTVSIVGGRVKEPAKGDLSDEIAAFANHEGGLIIFGVSDNREVLGVGADSAPLIHFLSEICHDSIEPPVIDYFVSSVSAPGESGQKILVFISVSRSLWPHQSAGGFFLRQEDAKREMTMEQIARLLHARSQTRIIRFDEQPVPRTDKSTLRKDLFTRFLRNVETEEQENALLMKRRLLVEDNGNYRASVAGLLMCSDQSQEYLYNSFISAVCYRGQHKDAHYQLDAKDFTGPLDRQILDACGFVKKHNQISARKEVGRVERPQYSMKAVFEAVVNAVVHRDYFKHSSKIRLFMFSDRLELYSPGALVSTLTVETLKDRCATRNELLSRLLSELSVEEGLGNAVGRKHFLERMGEGVGIILRESEELSGKRPIYEMHGEELCLTIFAAQSMQQP